MINCKRLINWFFIYFLFSLPLFARAQTSQQQDSLKQSSKPEAEVVDSLHYILNEVVVTGTRTYKKIIDIPYSVQRIDNSQFRFQKKTAVDNVLGAVPGLFLQSRYGNHDVRISIRGFGSRSNSGIRGVRILLDGIPESEPDGQTRIEAIDFNSVGYIEVVKGNLSSLYPNAPGGVINFINDIDFPRTFITSLNQFGSFDLRRNGFKAGIRTGHYAFLTTYTYHNSKGYRAHSEDYWHILNTVLETQPGDLSKLQILGYYVDGLIRLPGSLTKKQFEEDPFQAQQRDLDRDTKRISKKGRLGLRFNTFLDGDRKNEFEITGYGTIKYFERTSRVYRIINRYGLGTNLRYVNKSKIGGRNNEFSLGGEVQFQTGPVEYYDNIGGRKGDNLSRLINNEMSNLGAYFLNTFSLVNDKLDFLLSGRYDKTVFFQVNRLFEATKAKARYEGFTPKAALNYKLKPYMALYASLARSFTSPAGNELDNHPLSSNPNQLLNPDLEAQESTNFEVGIKGNLLYRGAVWFNNVYFEATVFRYLIDKEIIPFEVFGDVFFRNAAKTDRTGFEVGGNVEILRGLRFETAYSFSDFVYDEYIARLIDVDESGNIVTIERDFANNAAPSVPQHNFSMNLSYEYRFLRSMSGFTKGGLRSVSGMYVDDANSDKTGSFNVLDFMLGLDVNFNRFNMLLSGGVNNIFDNIHVGFININSLNGEFYEAGEPRNYFATINLGYRF